MHAHALLAAHPGALLAGHQPCMHPLPPAMTRAAQSIADRLAAAADQAGDGQQAEVTTVDDAAGGAAADAAATGTAAGGGDGGGGLNAGTVLGGGFAPSPSPPPLSPPAPPGVVVIDPKEVDNTMLVYTVDSAASLTAALTAANARRCTVPCSTITLTADIAVPETLRVNNSMVIVGACAAAPCKLDGGGDKQIMRITGLYGYVDFSSLQFVNGKQNSASTGIYGGAGARDGGGVWHTGRLLLHGPRACCCAAVFVCWEEADKRHLLASLSASPAALAPPHPAAAPAVVLQSRCPTWATRCSPTASSLATQLARVARWLCTQVRSSRQ